MQEHMHDRASEAIVLKALRNCKCVELLGGL